MPWRPRSTLEAIPCEQTTTPSALGDWSSQERIGKLRIEVRKQGLSLEPGNTHLQSVAARAFGSDGRRAEALASWRKLGAEGDAEAFRETYDSYKSYYRTLSDEPQLVKRVEAEAALRGARHIGNPARPR